MVFEMRNFANAASAVEKKTLAGDLKIIINNKCLIDKLFDPYIRS